MYDLNNVLGHIFILTLRWSGHGAENWSLITFFFSLHFPVIPLAQWSLKPLWNQSVCLRQAEKWYESPWVLKPSNLPITKIVKFIYACARTHTRTHKPQDISYWSHMRSSFCSVTLHPLFFKFYILFLTLFYFIFICK